MSGESPLRPRGPKSADSLMLGRVRLDIIDLRAIETHMNQIGQVSITSEQLDGEAPSMDGFTSLDLTRLETIRFRASREAAPWSSLWVAVTPERVSLISGDGDPFVSGVRVQIEQLLRTRERKASGALAWLGPLLCIVGTGAEFSAQSLFGVEGLSVAYGWSMAGLGLALLVLGVTGVLVHSRCKAEILLVTRESRPGWFQRNKDALAVQIIGGLVLLVGGILLGRWTG